GNHLWHCLRATLVLMRGAQAGRIGRGILDFLWQRCYKGRALNRHNFADLMQTKLGLATDDQVGDMATLLELRFRPYLVGYAKALEEFVDVDSARPAARRIDVGNRLRREQRVLECLDRADVRLGRALLHHDPDPDAGEVDPAAGRDLALAREIVDDGRGNDGDIESLPVFNPLLQTACSVIVDRNLVARLLFVGRHQSNHHLLERPGRKDFDVGCGTWLPGGKA